jgi:hypothetical protein
MDIVPPPARQLLCGPTIQTPMQGPLPPMTIRLTNADMDSASPFAGILIGQPTLARQLRMGTFAALVLDTRFHAVGVERGRARSTGPRCPPVPVFL